METETTTLPAQERKPQETIDSRSRGDVPLRWFTSILLLIFPTATLFLNRGDSIVLGLLTLIGIWVWLRDGARRWLDRPSAVLWVAFVLFFAVALLSYLLGTQTDAGFRFLGRYLRFLLIAPVYLALRRYPPTAKTVFIGLALGALLAGVIGGLHFLQAGGAFRVQATTGVPIIFGDLGATMTLCTVAGFGLLAKSGRNWAVPLLMLCVAGGVAAVVLSGSRGAWLPLILLILMLITSTAGFLKRRYVLSIILAIFTAFSFLYATSRTDTRVRIIQAFGSTADYFIARRILSSANGEIYSTPHCDAQRAFLAAWSSYYYVSNGKPPSGLSVVKDPSIRQDRYCQGEYAVLMQNNSVTNWAGYTFPRLARDLAGVQTSLVLVRGSGTFVLGKTGKDVISFHHKQYMRLALRNPNWSGLYIAIYIPPRESAWLLPIDSYYGEYTRTIANTSVGQRFEMWRAAWMMFLQHPSIGVGTGAFQDVLYRLVSDGKVAAFVKDYDHPHSDFFNALASAGVVGFLILLAIFLVPALRFWRALHGKDAVSHAVGLAGALTVLGFAIYALTDTIFLHSMMITWYVVYMALFYALLDAQAGKLTKPEPPKQ